MLSMISIYLVVLGYLSYRKNGAIMAAITETVTAITKMVRARMEAVPIDAIMGHHNLNSIRHLVDQLSSFVSNLATTKWGGKHGFLPLVLTDTKMRLADGIQDPKCRRIKRPELLNPKIEDDTKGHELVQIQEDHKVNWQEYTFQEAIDAMAVEATIAAVDAQYVEQIEEDYVGYKNQKIGRWSSRYRRVTSSQPRKSLPSRRTYSIPGATHPISTSQPLRAK